MDSIVADVVAKIIAMTSESPEGVLEIVKIFKSNLEFQLITIIIIENT